MHVCKDILIFPNCCYSVNNLLFVNLFPQLSLSNIWSARDFGRLTDMPRMAWGALFTKSYWKIFRLGWLRLYCMLLFQRMDASMRNRSVSAGTIMRGWSSVFPLCSDSRTVCTTIQYLVTKKKESTSDKHFYELCLECISCCGDQVVWVAHEVSHWWPSGSQGRGY